MDPISRHFRDRASEGDAAGGEFFQAGLGSGDSVQVVPNRVWTGHDGEPTWTLIAHCDIADSTAVPYMTRDDLLALAEGLIRMARA